MGKILDLTRPRMGALRYLDLTPRVDTVFDEISTSYRGPVTAAQDKIIAEAFCVVGDTGIEPVTSSV